MIVFVHRSVTFYLVYLATLLELSLLIRRMPSWYDLIPAHGYL